MIEIILSSRIFCENGLYILHKCLTFSQETSVVNISRSTALKKPVLLLYFTRRLFITISQGEIIFLPDFYFLFFYWALLCTVLWIRIRSNPKLFAGPVFVKT